MATISSIFRYPIKGFSPEPLAFADLTENSFFPGDRVMAFEAGASGYDQAAPAFISKMCYAVWARYSSVASFQTQYDAQNHTLTLDGQAYDLRDETSRATLCRVVSHRLAENEDYDADAYPLRLLDIAPPFEPDFRFTDSSKGFVSILNLNSVRDLSAKIGQSLDPQRMRANIWVDGWSAFEDHDWVGKRLKVGDEGPEFEVLKPIVRCVATHVNPETSARDVDVCQALWDHYGHKNCGIYVKIVRGGRMQKDQPIRLIQP